VVEERREAQDPLDAATTLSPPLARAPKNRVPVKPRIGILLVQLGSPDAPTPKAVRRFLREFLGDPRVVEVNRVLWWFILRGFILPFRPRRSAALYRRVWTPRGSPLILTTLEAAPLLETTLAGKARVEAGMRYGNPSLASAFDRLLADGIERLLVVPLFPQYSAATTASVIDAVGQVAARRRVVPALRVLPPFFDHPAYVGALQTTIREGLAALERKPDRLIFSFHGIPRRYVERGDPYEAHCRRTASSLAEALRLGTGEWESCFQSRFGREEWLRPYFDERIDELARSGSGHLAVACPGFVADCLETIDEIGREGKRRFVEAGGEDLTLIPCLNAHPVWIDALARIVREELAGWI
jgi:ferrochelatase